MQNGPTNAEASASFELRQLYRRHIDLEPGGTPDPFGVFCNMGFWAGQQPNNHQSAARRLLEIAADRLTLASGKRVLDVACGYGAGVRFLSRTFPGLRVVGIDILDDLIHEAKKGDAAASGDPGAEIGIMDATRMSFPDHSFDALLSVDAPFHFRPRRLFFREARRVLAPDGRIALVDIVFGSGRSRERELAEKLAEYWCIPHENVHGTREYREEMTAAGFHEIGIESIGKDVVPPACDYFGSRPFLLRIEQAFGLEAMVQTAQMFRSIKTHYDAGVFDYVLVTART